MLGLDLGLHASFTSCAAFWPSSSRLEVYTACPSRPALAARARTDGAGEVYERARSDGSLWIFDGEVTPLRPFLERVAGELAGCRVVALGVDQFRRTELTGALRDLGLPWRPSWRASGLNAAALMDGDVRAFQRGVTTREIRTAPNIMLAYAISLCSVVRDSREHVTHLHGYRKRARIDPVSASVIALGLAATAPKRSSAGKVYVA